MGEGGGVGCVISLSLTRMPTNGLGLGNYYYYVVRGSSRRSRAASTQEPNYPFPPEAWNFLTLQEGPASPLASCR